MSTGTFTNSMSDQANAYLRTRVMTASPEELRLMLLDGAIKFAQQGREGLASKNYEMSFNGIDRCRNIILELIVTVREDVAPELAKNVKALYTFFYNELTNASLEKNVAKIDKVIELLNFERETWVMLMDQLAKERAAGLAPEAVPASSAREQAPIARGEPISFQA